MRMYYILLKALLQVCMENQYEGVCREINSAQGKASAVFISRHVSSAVSFVHTSKGSALGGILYFELLLNQYRS